MRIFALIITFLLVGFGSNWYFGFAVLTFYVVLLEFFNRMLVSITNTMCKVNNNLASEKPQPLHVIEKK